MKLLSEHSEVRQAMPRSSKRSAPVATVSSGVVDGCSDIYPLLADGLFNLIATNPAQFAAERKLLLCLVASYRLLCKEMRRCVDDLIKSEFTAIIDTSTVLWEKSFALKKLKDATVLNEDKKEHTEAVEKYTTEVDKLSDAYKTKAERYFCAVYVRTTLAALKRDAQVKDASHLLTLHNTVANFMAIARERCYAQSCSGTKNAPNVASTTLGDNFTVVRYKDNSNGERILTLYCRSDAFYRLCATRQGLRSAQPDAGSKLAVEIFRRRDKYSFDGMYHRAEFYIEGDGACIEQGSGYGSIATVHNPTLILDFHDIDLPSIQKKLEVSASEVVSCKEEIQHKERQREERRLKMREVDALILEKDVDRAIARLGCGFNDLEEAKSVFPGAVENIRSTLRRTDHKANTHAFDIRQVAVSFKEIKTVMGPIRNFDSKNYNRNVASAEAYDFITGKSMSVIASDALLKEYCIREGPSVFMAKPSEDSGEWSLPVDVVCSAMRAFDLMEDWEMHSDSYDSKSSPAVIKIPVATSSSESEKWLRLTSDCFITELDNRFVDTVNTFAKQRSLDIVIPMPPANKDKKDKKNFKIWHCNTFRQLVAEPQTRSIALWMCNIYPRDLCRQIVQNSKLRSYLRSNGVHI